MKHADELKAWQARRMAVVFLRDEMKFTFRQIGRAIGKGPGEAQRLYHKGLRRQCAYCVKEARGGHGQGAALCEEHFTDCNPIWMKHRL